MRTDRLVDFQDGHRLGQRVYGFLVFACFVQDLALGAQFFHLRQLRSGKLRIGGQRFVNFFISAGQ